MTIKIQDARTVVRIWIRYLLLHAILRTRLFLSQFAETNRRTIRLSSGRVFYSFIACDSYLCSAETSCEKTMCHIVFFSSLRGLHGGGPRSRRIWHQGSVCTRKSYTTKNRVFRFVFWWGTLFFPLHWLRDFAWTFLVARFDWAPEESLALVTVTNVLR